MKRVNSVSEALKVEFNKDKLIDNSLQILINNFFLDVASGAVRAKNVEDLNKLINLSLLLKSMDTGDKENQELLLDNLGLTEDDSLKELYKRMSMKLNTDNDERNRPDDDIYGL